MELEQALMSIINTFAGTVTAIIVIATAVGIIKPIGNSLKRFFFAELYTTNDKQDKRLDNLEMRQLKQNICDRRLPLAERINDGDVYVERGGDGEIKMVYEALKKQFLEEQERLEQEERKKRRGA
jgi:uncharacterized membrane protein